MLYQLVLSPKKRKTSAIRAAFELNLVETNTNKDPAAHRLSPRTKIDSTTKKKNSSRERKFLSNPNQQFPFFWNHGQSFEISNNVPMD